MNFDWPSYSCDVSDLNPERNREKYRKPMKLAIRLKGRMIRIKNINTT